MSGLTSGEIAAHFAGVYGAAVSRDTVSRISDRVLEVMVAWQSRPLDEIYPVVLIDAIRVKIRDGQARLHRDRRDCRGDPRRARPLRR